MAIALLFYTNEASGSRLPPSQNNDRVIVQVSQPFSDSAVVVFFFVFRDVFFLGAFARAFPWYPQLSPGLWAQGSSFS